MSQEISIEEQYKNHKFVKYSDLIKHGFYSKFDDNGTVIEVRSTATGMERIYVNGELIIEKRNLTKLNPVHQFSHNGINYEIEIQSVSIKLGEIHIVLIKDGVHFQTQKFIALKPFRNSPLTKKQAILNLAMWAAVGFVVGFTAAYYFSKDEVPEVISMSVEFLKAVLG